MSGVEVVGVVLGVLPLVISAMERYADCVSTLGRFRRYKLELEALTTTLRTERRKLENTCDLLLVGIVPPTEIEALLDKPFDQQWHKPDLKNRIQLRLWKSYDDFQSTINDVHAAMEEMRERLGVDPDGTVRWLVGTSNSTFKTRLIREMKKAAFSLRKDSYDDLLTRIKSGITNLEKLTQQNIGLEPSRRTRSQGRYFSLLRGACKSVYRALEHGFSKQCHSSMHAVHLVLEPRAGNVLPKDTEMAITRSLSFRLAIINHKSDDSPYPILSYNDVVIRESASAATATESASQLSVDLSQSMQPVTIRIPSASSGKANGKGKSVWFRDVESSATGIAIGLAGTANVGMTCMASITQGSSSTSNAGASNIVATSTITTTAISVAQETSVVIPPVAGRSTVSACLCKSFTSAKVGNTVSCYGLITDSLNGKEFGVYPINGSHHEWPWFSVSLRQALDKEASPRKDKETDAMSLATLTYLDRLSLAFTISSSIIQLHGTPWLGCGVLTCDDILFFARNSHLESSNDTTPVYAQPFVAPKTSSHLKESGRAGASGSYLDSDTDSDMTFLWLGVLLIELILGRILRVSADTAHRGLEVYGAAKAALDEVEYQGGINYACAVKWCLEQCRRQFKPDDDKCWDDVQRNVVDLLEDSYLVAKG